MNRVWRTLAPEQRLAALCAAALFVTMLLPWYSTSGFDRRRNPVSDKLTAFGAFSFVEAAVLLVAAGVLWLLYARTQEKRFHLPGGDGTVIMAAGGWAAVLIFIRTIDKPSAGAGTIVGVEWGIFVAILAALALAYAGYRLRQAHLAEPPLPGEAPTRRQARASREPRAAHERDDAPAPRVQRGPVPDPHAASTEVAPRARRPRPDNPAADGGEQLSFDEQE